MLEPRTAHRAAVRRPWAGPAGRARARPRPGPGSPTAVGVDPRLRARRTLLAVSVAVTVAEAVALQVVGLRGSVGLAAQAAGPAPYAVFHDLRWLLVYHASLLGFAVEALAMWLVRSTLSAVLLRAAWADPDSRPGFWPAWRQSAAFTCVCALLMTPFAALMFGVAVASVSWLVLAAVPSVFAVSLFVGHGSATRRWYACAPPLRVAGWMALSFVAYTVLAAAATAAPWWLAVPLAALGGVFDAWAWHGIVRVEQRRRPRFARRRPVAVVGLVAFGLVVVAGTAIGFHATRIQVRLHPPAEATWSDGPPVLVVSGFGTPWSGLAPDYLGDGFSEVRFSYAGMTAHRQPLPYVGSQTYEPLPVLVRRMAAQVAAFHDRTGRPVSIVAESEGALVAEAYLHATPHPPVDHLVVLSPLVQPGRVYYPPATGSGYGVAAGWELRGLSATIQSLGSEAISGDNPFLRSVADHGPQLRGLLGCPVAGVDQLAVLPLADATSTPYSTHLAVPTVVVAGFHGGLLGEGHVEHLVARYLHSGRVPHSTALHVTKDAIQAAAAAWQVPELPVTVNPAWSGLSAGNCAANDRTLHRWVYDATSPTLDQLTQD